MMKIISSEVLPEILIIEPDVYSDKRGYFLETFHSNRYSEGGIPANFVQDNLSFSYKGVLRGLHYQIEQPQAKLVTVVDGEVFDVAVDIRIGSPSFGKWVGVTLSSENHRQLFIPEGFAHGFCVISEHAFFSYKCSNLYLAKAERGIIWNDNTININWPVDKPIVSDKDNIFPSISEMSNAELPHC
jgi:dTDP-4-dehydrorhamnose 3,5-epimerase